MTLKVVLFSETSFQHPLVQQKQSRPFYLNWQENLLVFRFVFQRKISYNISPLIEWLTYLLRGNVSLVDLTLNLEKDTSLAEIISTLDKASKGALQGVLSVEYNELVSCDFQGNPCSAVIDAKACVELNPRVRN